MKYNINHRSFFEREVPTVEVVPKVEDVTPVENVPVVNEEVKEDVKKDEESTLTEEEIVAMSKKEQISLLEELGLDKSEIKKLKYEDERVKKILEYM